MNALLLSSKQAARLAQNDIEINRLSAHAQVAVKLRDKHARKEVISSARDQIAKWRKSRLCSSDFIQAWEVLLESPVKAANVLEKMDPISIRLRQNSPFSAFLR